uniref:Immunoglobulin V-set domain-containing protein n=1 Tax=Hucho hucho TaxID=62062 RepID=A0A4W5JTC9_9TELE
MHPQFRFCDSSIDLDTHIVVTAFSCVYNVREEYVLFLTFVLSLSDLTHVQVNSSEPLCITSMWSSLPTVHHQNGFQEVDVADSDLYFCGMLDNYFINTTVLKVQETAMILGVVTTVLLIVILILVLKIRRDANTHNKVTMEDHECFLEGDPDSLNYAVLSFHQKRTRNKKTAKGLILEMEHVVYAATRSCLNVLMLISV